MWAVWIWSVCCQWKIMSEGWQTPHTVGVLEPIPADTEGLLRMHFVVKERGNKSHFEHLHTINTNICWIRVQPLFCWQQRSWFCCYLSVKEILEGSIEMTSQELQRSGLLENVLIWTFQWSCDLPSRKPLGAVIGLHWARSVASAGSVCRQGKAVLAFKRRGKAGALDWMSAKHRAFYSKCSEVRKEES